MKKLAYLEVKTSNEEGTMKNIVHSSELLVTYDGSNVMRWHSNDGRSGSDPVGYMTDNDAVSWAESLRAKMGCQWLTFSIDEVQ